MTSPITAPNAHAPVDFAISEALTEFRRRQALTQRDLAFVLGVSPATVARWESCSRYPSLDWIVRLARFMGVTADSLLGVER